MKCGLKVLIDESQAGANPFYCQRCTASIKAEVPEAAQATVKRDTPAKLATVKVGCPYCKATFNGRIPQRPAKGSCPVCQKDLILLPAGDIRPLAGFDLATWQKEQEISRTGTKTGLKKPTELGVSPVRVTQPEAVPAPVAVPQTPATGTPEPSGGDSSLPSWLDEEPAPGAAAAAARRDAIEGDSAVISSVDSVGTDIRVSPAEPLPAPETAPAAAEPLPGPAAVEPPVLPMGGRTATATPAVAAKKSITNRRERLAGPAAHVTSATGMGTVLLAFVLAALPVVGGAVLLQSKGKLKAGLSLQVGERFSKGLFKIYEQLVPPLPPPPPPPEEKKPEPPPEPPKPTEEDRQRDEAQIIKVWEEWARTSRDLETSLRTADDAQKAELEKVKEAVKQQEERLNALVEQYKKIYEKEFDPRQQ
jgi:hypothetical protein